MDTEKSEIPVENGIPLQESNNDVQGVIENSTQGIILNGEATDHFNVTNNAILVDETALAGADHTGMATQAASSILRVGTKLPVPSETGEATVGSADLTKEAPTDIVTNVEEWKDIENIVDMDPSSTAGFLILSKEAAGTYDLHYNQPKF